LRQAWDKEIEEFDLAFESGESPAPLLIKLPGKGQLRLDRRLPFMAFVRVPEDDPEYFHKLLNSSASYLIWDAKAARQDWGEESEANLQILLRCLIRRLQPHFGAFLLLELWPEGQRESSRVLLRKQDRGDEMWQTIQVRLPTLGFAGKLELGFEDPTASDPWSGALATDWARKYKVQQLGITVPVLYLSPKGEFFPSLFRAYRRKLDVILRHIFFAFMHEATPERPTSFHALGTRSLVKLVWKVDSELAAIANSFSLLLAITPTNVERAFQSFSRSGHQGEPAWEYRPLTVDPALLKGELFRIPIEQVDDPVFYRMFEQKRRQLELKITMLAYRRRPDFLHASMSLYGVVEPELKALALEILCRVEKSGSSTKERFLNAEEFAQRARREIRWYRRVDKRFAAEAHIVADMGRSIMCQGGNLLIGSDAKVSPQRLEALIQHEVGIHLVTAYNGKCQPLRQLSVGLSDYLPFQEGMAIVAEVAMGGLDRGRLRHLAGRVLAVDCLLSGMTFAETFNHLRSQYDFPLRALFEMVARVFRGGGFTKDAVYLRGLVETLRLIPQQEDFDGVFAGKIGFHHIPLIRELQSRSVLKPAPFRPRFLVLPSARQRIARLRSGAQVTDLVAISEGA
jgi:uncharacterized protein (TIGR02421 family)